MRRILAVGDIHGHYDKLINLMAKVKFDADEDFIVFLGDYIDRGPKNIDVLNYVYKLKMNYPDNVVALMGNHEDLMLDFFKGEEFDGGSHAHTWLYNGGDKTFRELRNLYKEDRNHADRLVQFIRDLPIYYLHEKILFLHAGFNPKDSIDTVIERADRSELLWRRESFYENYSGEVLCVIGHTPVQFLDNTEPMFMGKNKSILMCDTGSYLKNGKISCVDVTKAVKGELVFYQSD